MGAPILERRYCSRELFQREQQLHLWERTRKYQVWLRNHFRDDEFLMGYAFQNPNFYEAKVFSSIDCRYSRRSISRIFQNCCYPSASRRQGVHETFSEFVHNGNREHGRRDSIDRDAVKISPGHVRTTLKRRDDDHREGFKGLSISEEASCGDGGSGSGGAGRNWGNRGGNNGDEGEDWLWWLARDAHAHLMFLVGFFFMHVKIAGTRAVIPALLLHLFLHRDLIANADGITSSVKQVDENPISPSGLAREQEKTSSETPANDFVFEVQGGVWRRYLIDAEKDQFVIDPVKEPSKEAFNTDNHMQNNFKKSIQDRTLERSIKWCTDLVRNVMLPDGYPSSVTGDYLEYTLWRMGQNIASQINGVLTTQALLYAVGLGKGAIPTAAAVNWVLKDGIGYLSKIMLAKYGRHFDVHPKGWRLLADLIENASYALELLTPSYPHLFIYLGAAAGAGRSAAGLIQAATRSCFYAGFAAQRNFAEVIAKGEAQGMVSKSIGIALGIAISGYVGASGPMLVTAFLTVMGVHMFCNLRSYQAVQLRTLNPYRASLVFCELIRRGVVASVEEVNAEEPIFPEIPSLLFRLKGKKDHSSNLLSSQTKEDAAIIATKLNLGVSFVNIIRSQKEAFELLKVYQNEQYVLAERQNSYRAMLKEGATSHDLLKLMLHVCYLYQLQNGPWRPLAAEGKPDFDAASPVEISYKLTVDNFERLQQELAAAGWAVSDGLVARPLPYRLLEVPHKKDDGSM